VVQVQRQVWKLLMMTFLTAIFKSRDHIFMQKSTSHSDRLTTTSTHMQFDTRQSQLIRVHRAVGAFLRLVQCVASLYLSQQVMVQKLRLLGELTTILSSGHRPHHPLVSLLAPCRKYPARTPTKREKCLFNADGQMELHQQIKS